MTEDHISALERLAKLKADGAISDTEYGVQKARLLGSKTAVGESSPVPVWRRLWLVVTLTLFVFTFWAALAILASGEVYRKRPEGWTAISRGARLTYAGFLALWLVALLAKAIFHPGDWGTESNPAKPAATASAAANAPKSQPTPAPSKQAASTVSAPATTQATTNQPQDAQSAGPAAPLEGRYSEQYRQCMAGEDAAGGSTSAMMACTNQELNVQVAKLNDTYKGLMTALPTDQRSQLRADQSVFIQQLQTQCREGDTEANGQLAMLDRPSCLLSKTIERAMALEKLQAQSGQQ